MSRKGSKRNTQQRIAELEHKKRSGLIRCVASIVLFAIIIALKLSLQPVFVWLNSTAANAAIFILALVAAGFAGIGSRDWTRARRELESLSNR